MQKTIRETAASVGFEIKGKLKLWGIVNKERVYIDEEGNEFTLCAYDPGAGEVLIVDKDGAIWT
jgi:hypothetical protein